MFITEVSGGQNSLRERITRPLAWNSMITTRSFSLVFLSPGHCPQASVRCPVS
jgi:hypothetical protein